MEDLRGLTRGQNAALVFAFLQADCTDFDYRKELLSLAEELNLFQGIRNNGPRPDFMEDGFLETDGHLPCGITGSLGDILPSVDQWPRDRMEAAAFLQVAEGLRDIAAQLEQDVVARGIRNLNSHISVSPSEQWNHHLVREVERAMRQGVGLDHLPQERVLMALTLTLVRGVCVQAPRLLRSLFSAALHLISPAGAR